MNLSPRAIEAAIEEFENLDYRDMDSMPSQEIVTRILTAYHAALAVDGLCLVEKDALSVVLDAAEMHWDEGPFDEGWQSRKLIDACEKVGQSMAAASTMDSPRQEKI